MKISVTEQGTILLEEVYNGIGFITKSGKKLAVCMRDDTYEINAAGIWFRVDFEKQSILPLRSFEQCNSHGVTAGEYHRCVFTQGHADYHSKPEMEFRWSDAEGFTFCGNKECCPEVVR